MNDLEMEQKLADSGFTVKELAVLRSYREKGGATLSVLLNELRQRLLFSISILFLLCIAWCTIAVFGNEESLVSFSVTMMIFFVIAYFITPMKIGIKSYLFFRKR